MISVDEYLAANYRPDRDHVDGVVEQRNIGLKNHSRLQGEVLFWFHQRRGALAIATFPEQRVRVSERRFRIPDSLRD